MVDAGYCWLLSSTCCVRKTCPRNGKPAVECHAVWQLPFLCMGISDGPLSPGSLRLTDDRRGLCSRITQFCLKILLLGMPPAHFSLWNLLLISHQYLCLIISTGSAGHHSVRSILFMGLSGTDHQVECLATFLPFSGSFLVPFLGNSSLGCQLMPLFGLHQHFCCTAFGRAEKFVLQINN